ncbi:hypothetical protein HK414_13175 [Ramlibacter terrae]|uniref:Uncharacterized protein n=1 Tax=Ramlibacter terrae TaxID=2732511 RepID=A0ABX6P491_9BURK|nr:hypothetical protein HK414_13175 [Ramlibacter terrae]
MAVVDKVVDKKGTRAVAEEYLKYLYSEEGQDIAGKHFYRPAVSQKAQAKYAAQFPKLNLFTIDQPSAAGTTRPRCTSRTTAASTRSTRASKGGHGWAATVEGCFTLRHLRRCVFSFPPWPCVPSAPWPPPSKPKNFRRARRPTS